MKNKNKKQRKNITVGSTIVIILVYNNNNYYYSCVNWLQVESEQVYIKISIMFSNTNT